MHHTVDVYNVTWQTLDGCDVRRIADARYAALPITGRKNATLFTMFHVDDREELCQLRKSEVDAWLCKMARSEDVPCTGTMTFSN